MDIEKRIELIKRLPTEEVIVEEDLRKLLEEKKHPSAYDGFEPSGLLHIGSGLLRAIKLNDMIEAGVEFKLFVADWHAWINQKFGGDLDKIQTVGKYFMEGWKACGVDMKKAEVVWASDLVKDPEYWKTVLDVARRTTLKRMIRAGTIMGRKEDEMLYTGQLFYAAMQATDPFYLGVDICQLGMDQRKVTVLSREIAPALGFKPVVCIHHHLLLGLSGPTRMGKCDLDDVAAGKMSKSIKGSCIYIHDSEDEIKKKINSAYCPEKIADSNPVTELWKYVIFNKFDSWTIKRPDKFGGNLDIQSYSELEKLYGAGDLHPMDLKSATAEALNEILEPVRKHFEAGKAKELYETVKKFETTR
ncbi:tyrosine--tRNA ligase [Candidatus Undinarchaeota archaeon]